MLSRWCSWRSSIPVRVCAAVIPPCRPPRVPALVGRLGRDAAESVPMHAPASIQQDNAPRPFAASAGRAVPAQPPACNLPADSPGAPTDRAGRATLPFHRRERGGEVGQSYRPVDQAQSGYGPALLIQFDDGFHHVVHVALGIDPSRNGQSHQIQSRPVP